MSNDSASRPRRRWLQVSLRTLLLLMLFVCVFLAGRHSLQTELDRVRAEASELRQQSEQVRQESAKTLMLINAQQQFQPRSSWQSIEEGMKVDALERQQRMFNARPFELIPR